MSVQRGLHEKPTGALFKRSHHDEPCSALIEFVAGPMAGAAFVEPETHPPAVIPEFFHKVCHTKTVIDPSDMRTKYFDASAMTTISAWIDKLARAEDRCVEIMPKTNSIFEFW